MSINFTPATVGAFTANLQVADNAPGSPQILVLNGTGIAPTPAVTFSTSALSFPSINQGTSSAPQTLTVISSGNIALHISSVSLAGANPSDFSCTNICTAPLAPGSNCTISVTFNPTAPGQRVANLMIADDASGFPQTVTLSGTGIAVVPALTFSPPAPALLALLFFLSALARLESDPRTQKWRAFQPSARRNRLTPCGVLSAAIFCITFTLAGCGGGNAAITTTPPPIVTPSGTSTITISLSASSSTGQPLLLQPIQLTLTVK